MNEKSLQNKRYDKVEVVLSENVHQHKNSIYSQIYQVTKKAVQWRGDIDEALGKKRERALGGRNRSGPLSHRNQRSFWNEVSLLRKKNSLARKQLQGHYRTIPWEIWWCKVLAVRIICSTLYLNFHYFLTFYSNDIENAV